MQKRKPLSRTKLAFMKELDGEKVGRIFVYLLFIYLVYYF